VAKVKKVQVGNYRADVDAQGLDPEMARTLGLGSGRPDAGPTAFRPAPKPESRATTTPAPPELSGTQKADWAKREEQIQDRKAKNAGARSLNRIMGR
jgi:hypothetical protein